MTTQAQANVRSSIELEETFPASVSPAETPGTDQERNPSLPSGNGLLLPRSTFGAQTPGLPADRHESKDSSSEYFFNFR